MFDWHDLLGLVPPFIHPSFHPSIPPSLHPPTIPPSLHPSIHACKRKCINTCVHANIQTITQKAHRQTDEQTDSRQKKYVHAYEGNHSSITRHLHTPSLHTETRPETPQEHPPKSQAFMLVRTHKQRRFDLLRVSHIPVFA